jgi:hypothetical protein
MSLDLHPDVERLVMARAQAAGMSPSDYLARLLAAGISTAAPTPAERVHALLQEWQQADGTPTAMPAPNEGTLTPSEALFRQWEQEDAGLSEDERRAEAEAWQQFQQDINAERAAARMRPIF